jgi:hypothetical protein
MAGKFSIAEALTRHRLDRFGKLTYAYIGGGGDDKPEAGAVLIAQNNVKMPAGVVAYENELGNQVRRCRLNP